ncbi:MAG: hypothetical protein K0U74_11995 [Alphaproteobacteria bacterium]|nr:hypothetical protein [Alphaproteobacteria bacterium]
MPAKAKSKADDKQHPVYKNQLGSLQVAVWANTRDVDGEDRTFHSITLERGYRNKDDLWQKTGQLREQDVANAIVLLQGVQEHLMNAEAV